MYQSYDKKTVSISRALVEALFIFMSLFVYVDRQTDLTKTEVTLEYLILINKTDPFF